MSAADMFWAAPPVARTITAAAVALSVPTHMNLISPSAVVFLRDQILTFKQAPEVWRLFTSLILTGGGLSLIFDPYFLYTYSSQLETEAARFSQPGDFFTYLAFVCGVIVLLGGFWLNGVMLLSCVNLALAYTYAQENPHRQVSFFIITFPAKWLPLAMLTMTFVMASPQAALVQAMGLVAAHMYDFLTRIWPEYGRGAKLIHTPQTVRRWFEVPGGTARQRAAGTAYAAHTGGSGSTASASGNSWGERGPGRRLG